MTPVYAYAIVDERGQVKILGSNYAIFRFKKTAKTMLHIHWSEKDKLKIQSVFIQSTLLTSLGEVIKSRKSKPVKIKCFNCKRKIDAVTLSLIHNGSYSNIVYDHESGFDKIVCDNCKG